VLVGPNAVGKTTVLEAISYASALRSFRRTPDAAMVRTDTTGAVIRAGFIKEAGETRIEIELPAGGRRRVLVNGKRPSRLSEVATIAPVVAFLPDDLDLVKDSAGARRSYLDELGSQLTPAYGAALSEYEQILRQRNALLRRDGPSTDMLTLKVWDERIVKAAVALWGERVDLAAKLRPSLGTAHDAIAVAGTAGSPDRRAPGDPLILMVTPAWGDAPRTDFAPGTAAEAMAEALVQRRRRELEQRTTTVGPHRDDVSLALGRRDTRTQASQGEQRSVAVALRVAAYRLLHDRHGHPPVLLLDDVFSELDLVRTAAVMDMLPAGQVFVTTTREDEVPVAGRRWDVGGGTVKEGWSR
jgi:DNA replication and repair protein RecF